MSVYGLYRRCTNIALLEHMSTKYGPGFGLSGSANSRSMTLKRDLLNPATGEIVDWFGDGGWPYRTAVM